MTRRIILFVLLCLGTTLSMAQNSGKSIAQLWAEVDTLIDVGYLKEAHQKVLYIQKKARAEKDALNITRANITDIKFIISTSDAVDSAYLLLRHFRNLPNSPIEKAIINNLLAEAYWDYYKNNSRVINRKNVDSIAPDASIATWTSNIFSDSVTYWLNASLEQKALLLKIPAAPYFAFYPQNTFDTLLTRNLYELLAKRALRYYRRNEHNISRPRYNYQITDKAYLGDLAHFLTLNVPVKNNTEPIGNALVLFQILLRNYTEQNNQEALAYYDLERLGFVYNNREAKNEVLWYYNSLLEGEQRYANTRYQSMYALKAIQLQQQNRNVHFIENKSTTNLWLVQQYEAFLKKYPNSLGANEALAGLDKLKAISFETKAEDVIPSDSYSKFLLEYKNLDSVFVQIMPADSFYAKCKNRNACFYDYFARNVSDNDVVALINPKDYASHSTEIKIDPLPVGKYFLIVSTSARLDTVNKNYVVNAFQVSNISWIETDSYLQFLDRTSGKPLEKVCFELTYEDKEKRKLFSDKYGKIYVKDFSINKDIDTDVLSYGHEKIENFLYELELVYDAYDDSDDYDYLSYYDRDYFLKSKRTTETQIFTDRAIYRPGQTLYYKGITLKRNKADRSVAVLPHYNTYVLLLNDKSQIIDSIPVKTNEFGSFNGSFVIPNNILLGDMYLQVDNNEDNLKTVKVEEYKRPTYYIDFDSVQSTYRFHDQVVVTGKVLAYAGNPIDGATVKYEVNREVSYPYYWRLGATKENRYRRNNDSITSGTTIVNADGSFAIAFEALADTSIDLSNWPTFVYHVNATVTDINGETRTSSEEVRVGYQPLKIEASVYKYSGDLSLQNIVIQTRNMNNFPVAAQVKVNIYALDGPKEMLKERYWEAPDLPIYDEATFKKWFPYDVYKSNDDPATYPRLATVFTSPFLTNTQQSLNAVDSIKQNGWYEIEIIAQDNIIQKYYTYYFDEKNSKTIALPILTIPNKMDYKPNDILDLKVLVGAPNAYVQTYSTKTSSRKNFNSNHFRIEEKDKGGISYIHYYVWQNRYYKSDYYAYVPYFDKQMQVSWATHRTTILPGAEETWTMKVRGHKNEKVTAEMMATLYDASLDALHEYDLDCKYYLFRQPYARVYTSIFEESRSGRGALHFGSAPVKEKDKPFSEEFTSGFSLLFGANVQSPYNTGAILKTKWVGAADRISATNVVYNIYQSEGLVAPQPPAAPSVDTNLSTENETPTPQIRKNFNETAFFKPDLRTDEEGNITFSFQMPEALTKWNLVTLAHTQDWKVGTLQGSVITQKELMVMPNMPRFFRQNDEVVLATKVVNLSDKDVQAKVTIDILNAKTLQSLQLPFRIKQTTQKIAVAQGKSEVVQWTLHIPESVYEPVIVRIVADAGTFSDGEEHLIPVVPNRTLVTESIPLPMSGNGSKTFQLQALLDNQSKTLAQYGLTVEYTSNPTWLVVQALPYLTNYPYDCAEQTFSKFYGNALAADIVNASPKVKAIFEQWSEKDSTALLSSLEKNESLKSALLEETPWVLEAQNESEQKQRLGLLFQTKRMQKDLEKTLAKLVEKQEANGAYSWFDKGYPSRYITQTIILGLSKMKQAQIAAAQSEDVTTIIRKSWTYLDTLLYQSYQQILESKVDTSKLTISSDVVQLLYIYALNADRALDTNINKALQYYRHKAKVNWPRMNLNCQAQIAILMQEKEPQLAKDIVEALRQNAIKSEEQGMYWKSNIAGYSWYDAPIENQALLIEAFRVVGAPADEIAAMQTWIIKSKQTNRWSSTKATVDATFALLGKNKNLLEASPKVEIQLGKYQIASDQLNTEAGTGYFQHKIPGLQVKNDMGNIKVTVSDNNANLPSWGAVYWQYFEQYDNIKASTSGLSISKTLYKEVNSQEGKRLESITPTTPLKVGDKVVVRLVVTADNTMEFVHIKDSRAGCFEPIDVLSGYHYEGGLRYYQTSRDLSSNFFIDKLSKGTYVLEYAVFANAAGTYSNGIANIQCMYAPEFTAHSNGSIIEVK